MKTPVGSIIGSLLSIVIFCALPIPPAAANDSTAELAIGGLVFVRNNDIEMLSEDLFISLDEIRVHYRFLNKSDRDIIVHVAFPLPDLKASSMDDAVMIPTDDPINFVGFATTADGRPVHATVEQKVYVNDRDETQALTRLRIPLSPFAAQDVISKLPAAERASLKRLGLIDDEGLPLWTLKTAFFWQQQFAAGRETVIEHRYKPRVGTVVPIGAAGLAGWLKKADYRKYCPDEDLLATLARSKSDFSQWSIDYVLKTGANWAGPIKDFRLVVDKGSPDNLVSFCGQGVKRIGTTQSEMKKLDFTPQQDLAILILKPLR